MEAIIVMNGYKIVNEVKYIFTSPKRSSTESQLKSEIKTLFKVDSKIIIFDGLVID